MLAINCVIGLVVYLQLVNCLDLDEIDKLDIPEIVEARGFTCETHYITTSDGYILGNYRIVNPHLSQFNDPQRKKQLSKPIIVQSGFLGSAVDFIINSPRGFVNSSILENYNDLESIDFDLDGRNLGFILANLGYDVWLTNPRGNYYSSNHIKLNSRQDAKKFWSFSLDEMANIDLPAIIDYVLNETNQETVGYIGFSRGSFLMFGLLADQPEYSDKIKPFIALAPPVFLTHTNSPLIHLARNRFIQNYIRNHPGPCLTRPASKLTGMCTNILIRPLCNAIKSSILPIGGSNNKTRMDIYLSHLPAGSSCWDLVHFSQRMTRENFTHIDLGEEINLRRYGTPTPREYNLSNIDNPNIAIFHATGDNKANPEDVQKLIDHLKVPLVERLTINDEEFTHLDFLFESNVGTLVNKPIAKLLDKYR